MLKKNQIIDIKIHRLNFPNKGIGIFDDETVTIKNTIPNQVVRAKIIKARKNRIQGDVIEVLENSPYETEKGCSKFGVCGGCSYQRLSIENEMKLKEEQVLRLLKNEGIEDFKYEGIITPENISGYRNKCEFSFGDEELGGELALGMRKRNSFYEVVTLTDCNIVPNDFLIIIDCVLKFFKERNTSFYHKKTHKGVLRHLVVRRGHYTEEILINLVTSSEFKFSYNEFVEAILNSKIKGKVSGILHTINDDIADTVKTDNLNILYGENSYNDRLLGLSFKISINSFFQTNTKGAEALYSAILEYIGDTKDKIVFDLYCGTGTIGILASKNAKKVYGIELIADAVYSANENARNNNVDNCTFIAGDVLTEVENLKDKPDIIILDPPRDGIHPKAIDKIIDFNCNEIIYVSCKPTSLARDLAIFKENGYKIEKLRLINQFPKTVHVEMCVLLSHKNS